MFVALDSERRRMTDRIECLLCSREAILGYLVGEPAVAF